MSARTHARGQDWQGGRTRCGRMSDPRRPLSMIEDDALPTCAQCIKGGLADARAGDVADIHPAFRSARS
jgi:hypothetical protein